MVTPFSTQEARVNAAVFARLANATADLGSGVMVDGVFHEAAAEAFGFVGGEHLVFDAQSKDLAGVAEGAPVTVGGNAYTVAAITTDGTGRTSLKLEKP